MNFTEQLVAMMVAVLVADGKQEAEEIEVIRSVANDFELDKNEVEVCIAAELAQPHTIKQAARGIKKDDKEAILSACVAMALTDKYLCQSEVEIILEIAEALKVSSAKAILQIAAYVQNDRSILIEGNDALHMDDAIEIDEE